MSTAEVVIRQLRKRLSRKHGYATETAMQNAILVIEDLRDENERLLLQNELDQMKQKLEKFDAG